MRWTCCHLFSIRILNVVNDMIHCWFYTVTERRTQTFFTNLYTLFIVFRLAQDVHFSGIWLQSIYQTHVLKSLISFQIRENVGFYSVFSLSPFYLSHDSFLYQSLPTPLENQTESLTLFLSSCDNPINQSVHFHLLNSHPRFNNTSLTLRL